MAEWLFRIPVAVACPSKLDNDAIEGPSAMTPWTPGTLWIRIRSIPPTSVKSDNGQVPHAPGVYDVIVPARPNRSCLVSRVIVDANLDDASQCLVGQVLLCHV